MAEPIFTTEELQSEEWREIPGYQGCFASSLGRIRGRSGIVLRFQPNKGYVRVTLNDGNRIRRILVHRLVAITFISAMPTNKPCVNHIDGCRTNNRMTNLEWCTHKENSQHAVHVTKTMTHGTSHYRARITPEIVLQIHNWRMDGLSSHKIAHRLGVGYTTIEHILRRRTWTRYTANLPTDYPVIPHDHDGTANPNAKLDEHSVRAIRKLLAEGVSGPKIAKQFGVNHGAIYDIKNGKKWTHVT